MLETVVREMVVVKSGGTGANGQIGLKKIYCGHPDWCSAQSHMVRGGLARIYSEVPWIVCARMDESGNVIIHR